MTKLLVVWKGLQPAPGDPEPTESASKLVLKALDNASSGIDLSTDGFNPGMPPLKSGNWDDSVTQDGRSVSGNTVENVTDTIRLSVSGTTWEQVYRNITLLNRFIADARRNTSTFYQIDPVYLEWWADGAPAPQYAKIANIEVDPKIDRKSNFIAELTIVVEREPAWRAIPPGANPGLYTKYSVGANPGADFDYADINIIGSPIASFASGTVENRNSYSSSDYSEPSTVNWLDIENIPGDAPALTMISTEATQVEEFGAEQLFFWRSTKPLQLPTRGGAGAVRGRPVTMNGSDAQYGTGVSRVNDATYGVVGGDTGVAAVARYAASATYCEWGRHTTAPTYEIDLASMRGRYMVFARGRQVNGSVGAVQLQLSAYTAGVSSLTLDAVNAVSVLTYLNTTYLGVIEFPLNSRAPMGVDGRGVLVTDSQTMIVRLSATGTTLSINYDLVDLVFVGIDEDNVMINNASSRYNVLDGTGYVTHGDHGDALLANYVVDTGDQMEIRGNSLTLIPGITNRVHLLSVYPADNTFPSYHHAHASHVLRVWIVPRWYGPRDE